MKNKHVSYLAIMNLSGLIYFLNEIRRMNGVDLECHEDMRDIYIKPDIDEKMQDKIEAFAAAFRCNQILSYFTDVDEYITAGAFILLAHRSCIPPRDYQAWILPAVLLSWSMHEESSELKLAIEEAFDMDGFQRIHRKAVALTKGIGWKTHTHLDELEEVLKLMRVVTRDILRTRSNMPRPWR